MAQKITLSIPDLLHEKLKEWRASFNLSKMFQEVVTDAILKKEEFQKRFSKDYNMSEIIKRLKQEKLIWEIGPCEFSFFMKIHIRSGPICFELKI